MIPYGRQNISQQDIDAVVDVLRSDFLTQGPNADKFEKAVAKRVDARFGVATNSATSALHIACLALDIGKGDLVWTSPITFVASANCALYCGADVDFVDVDLTTANMCADALETKLILAKKMGRLPKVVIPVHFSGQSCNMQRIHELSQEYGFKIIEDASHAIGASYKKRPVGCCEFSDISIFSFHPVKIITTAEGGIATTNDPVLAKQMERYKSHGITRNTDTLTRGHDEPWYYEQHTLGHNYRMTEMQAALGLSQLKQLDVFVNKRNELRQKYDVAFPQHQRLNVFSDAISSCHLYVIQVSAERRLDIFNALRANNIGVNVHYIPVYFQPYYKNLEFEFSPCPNAELYYSQAISIPLHPQLTDDQQRFIIEKVNQLLHEK